MEKAKEWHRVSVPKSELDLDLTLSSGQVFSWHPISDEDDLIEWRGIIQDRLAVCRAGLRETICMVQWLAITL